MPPGLQVPLSTAPAPLSPPSPNPRHPPFHATRRRALPLLPRHQTQGPQLPADRATPNPFATERMLWRGDRVWLVPADVTQTVGGVAPRRRYRSHRIALCPGACGGAIAVCPRGERGATGGGNAGRFVICPLERGPMATRTEHAGLPPKIYPLMPHFDFTGGV